MIKSLLAQFSTSGETQTETKNYKFGFFTALSVVVASMIGTGVFTSLGFQLLEVNATFSILLLWLLGGIISFCGALVYAELGVTFPQSGGEYVYISKLIHPAVGFLSGWCSSTVGFAAPVALAAMALGKYVESVFPTFSATSLAVIVVMGIALIHVTNLKNGSRFQRCFTFLKIAIILLFISAGLAYTPTHSISIQPTSETLTDLGSAGFWVSLIFVGYAYSGWNASSYLAEEMHNPEKTLPRSLFWGTATVCVIYLLLNFIFMYTVPKDELRGVLEIGHVSASAIFGQALGRMMSLLIAILLISSISAMTMAGPRITKRIGEDLPALGFLSKTNSSGSPYVAILFQTAIAVTLIITGKFDQVLTFVGFSLEIFTFIAVASIFVLRTKRKDLQKPGYKTFLYPITPIIFLCLIAFTMYFVFMQKTTESLLGLANLGVGFIVYLIGSHRSKLKPNQHVE